MDASHKFTELEKRLKSLGSLLVAFSGGVDSTFLAKAAHDALGERCLAVTARSETYPAHEQKEAEELAAQLKLRHRLIETSELGIPGFSENPPERCYYCKTELFKTLWQIAESEGIEHVADGATTDDLSDFRPGSRAARELRVISPLQDAELSKAEIRALSKQMGLPTWNKPSYACLASRIPYREPITPEKLKQIDQAEEFLRGLGFRTSRVRHHGAIARIEVPPSEFPRLVSGHPAAIAARFKALGFAYTALDLAGYRTGSMNEVLEPRANED
jgi:uncharacterized protein